MGGEPGWSSSRRNSRPTCASTPSTSKKFAVTRAAVTRSGARPLAERWAAVVASARADPASSILPRFAAPGLVDVNFAPKSALSAWDDVRPPALPARG